LVLTVFLASGLAPSMLEDDAAEFLPSVYQSLRWDPLRDYVRARRKFVNGEFCER
jgi:hypothetical protein